jgi:hypothetical protein
MQRPAHVNEQRKATMTEKLTKFDYLLNAMHHAGLEANPANAGYGDKRRALFEHVRALEKDAERYRWLRDNANEQWEVCFDDCGRNLLCGDRLSQRIDAALSAAPAVGAA